MTTTNTTEQLSDSSIVELVYKQPQRSLKILIIDDDQAITKLFCNYLTLKGHRCTVSNDGRVGANILLEQRFDVVLLDLSMPGFSGLDVINFLENNGIIKKQKIIICSASPNFKPSMDILLKKVDACISKPIRLEVLLKIVEQN